jgi:hypothetical protein
VGKDIYATIYGFFFALLPTPLTANSFQKALVHAFQCGKIQAGCMGVNGVY